MTYSGRTYASAFFVTNRNFGSVYKVTFQQRKGKDGICEEKVTIGLKESTAERTFNTNCLAQGGGRRSVRNEGDVLIIGSPEDNFFAFTSNSGEIIFQQDGKWKKGGFAESSEDKDITDGNHWQEFLNKHREEINKFEEVMETERNRLWEERSNLCRQERREMQTYWKNIKKLIMLQNEELRKYRLDRATLSERARKEGRTDELTQLLEERKARHNEKIAEIEHDKSKETDRYYDVHNGYEERVGEAVNKCVEELERIYELKVEEEKKMMKQMNENIMQG